MQAIHAADAIWSRTLGRIINGQALIIVEDERQAALAIVKWERRKACLRLSFELRKESCCVKMMIMKEYVHVNTWIHLAMASSVSIGWNCRSCCQSISCCCSGAQPDGNMAMMKKCAATMGNKMANVKQQSQSLSNHAKLEKSVFLSYCGGQKLVISYWKLKCMKGDTFVRKNLNGTSLLYNT